MLEVIREPIPGLLVIKPKIFRDERGFFLETWQRNKYKEIGIKSDFVQDNWSRSTKGILRGLHFQKQNPQGKLVSVRTGVVFDVAVDIRKDSPSFGKWHSEILSDDNHLQMYIPPGFAHGFCVISEIADFEYKCTDYYRQEDESGIVWDDKNLNINWPKLDFIVSDKDLKLPNFNK